MNFWLLFDQSSHKTQMGLSLNTYFSHHTGIKNTSCVASFRSYARLLLRSHSHPTGPTHRALSTWLREANVLVRFSLFSRLSILFACFLRFHVRVLRGAYRGVNLSYLCSSVSVSNALQHAGCLVGEYWSSGRTLLAALAMLPCADRIQHFNV